MESEPEHPWGVLVPEWMVGFSFGGSYFPSNLEHHICHWE